MPKPLFKMSIAFGMPFPHSGSISAHSRLTHCTLEFALVEVRHHAALAERFSASPKQCLFGLIVRSELVQHQLRVSLQSVD